MVNASCASKPHRHPDAVPRHGGVGRHLAATPSRGPVPQHLGTGRLCRSHLQRRPARGYRTKRRLSHRESGQLRVERGACGVLFQTRDRGSPDLVQLGRRHQRRTDGGDATHYPDSQQSPARDPSALRRQVRRVQYSGRLRDGLEQQSGRAGTLRSSVQHHRAPDRADRQRRSRHRRGWQGAPDQYQSGPGPVAGTRALNPGCGSSSEGVQPDPALWRHQSGQP